MQGNIATPDLWYDNTGPPGDQRRANIRLRNAPGRTRNACGGLLKAFAYEFISERTQAVAGTAIVLCNDRPAGRDAPAALQSHFKISGNTQYIGDFKDNALNNMAIGIDFLGGFLSHMILHEVMHATDFNACKYNSRCHACVVNKLFNFDLVPPMPEPNALEKYGYQEITGHAIGQTGNTGPTAAFRQKNADSYALLASG